MATIIRGIPQTKAALARVELEIRAAAPQAARAGGEVLGRAMAARAPRDTGEMAQRIGVETDGDTTRVGSDAAWTRFVQGGTRYMSAQPFMTEAAEASTSGIVAAIAAVLKAAIH